MIEAEETSEWPSPATDRRDGYLTFNAGIGWALGLLFALALYLQAAARNFEAARSADYRYASDAETSAIMMQLREIAALIRDESRRQEGRDDS